MSEARCISTPISWLRLEQLFVGDLAGAASALAREHISSCAACEHSYQMIERDRRALPPLQLSSSAPAVSLDHLTTRLRRWLLGGGVAIAVAAAAALILFLSRGGPSPEPRQGETFSRRVAIKGGGDLVLTLVRQRGAVQAIDPIDFAAGDQFVVQLTCAEPGVVALDAVVIQGEAVYRPLGEAPTIHCGNNVRLPGAFSADGAEPIVVCVAPRANRPSPLGLGDFGGAACAVLAPRPTP